MPPHSRQSPPPATRPLHGGAAAVDAPSRADDPSAPRARARGQALAQLRSCGVLEAVRVSQAGYPTRLPFTELLARYAILVPHEMMARFAREKSGGGGGGAAVPVALRRGSSAEVAASASSAAALAAAAAAAGGEGGGVGSPTSPAPSSAVSAVKEQVRGPLGARPSKLS